MSKNGTSTAAERHKRLTESLQRIVEPVRAEVAEIDERLMELDAERAELLSAKGEAMKVLRAADPVERAKYRKSGPKNSGRKQKSGVASDRVEQFGVWLQEHRAEFPDGFTSPELQARSDSPIREKTTVTRVLQILAEDGRLRLDSHREFHPDGSRVLGRRPRVYKLVSDGGT